MRLPNFFTTQTNTFTVGDVTLSRKNTTYWTSNHTTCSARCKVCADTNKYDYPPSLHDKRICRHLACLFCIFFGEGPPAVTAHRFQCTHPRTLFGSTMNTLTNYTSKIFLWDPTHSTLKFNRSPEVTVDILVIPRLVKNMLLFQRIINDWWLLWSYLLYKWRSVLVFWIFTHA